MNTRVKFPVGAKVEAPLPLDAIRFNNQDVPYTNITEVLAENLLATRTLGQIFYVNNGNNGINAYWFKKGIADVDLELIYNGTCYIDSISDLKSIEPKSLGDVVITKSYYGDNKGGGNTFECVSLTAGSYVNNDGTIIIDNNGRVWEAIFRDEYLDAAVFGVRHENLPIKIAEITNRLNQMAIWVESSPKYSGIILSEDIYTNATIKIGNNNYKATGRVSYNGPNLNENVMEFGKYGSHASYANWTGIRATRRNYNTPSTSGASVVLYNPYQAIIEVVDASQSYIGLHIPVDGGAYFNQIKLNNLIDNKIGILIENVLSSTPGVYGAFTESSFHGGSISQTVFLKYSDITYIKMSYGGLGSNFINGVTFHQPTLEVPSSGQNTTLIDLWGCQGCEMRNIRNEDHSGTSMVRMREFSVQNKFEFFQRKTFKIVNDRFDYSGNVYVYNTGLDLYKNSSNFQLLKRIDHNNLVYKNTKALGIVNVLPIACVSQNVSETTITNEESNILIQGLQTIEGFESKDGHLRTVGDYYSVNSDTILRIALSGPATAAIIKLFDENGNMIVYDRNTSPAPYTTSDPSTGNWYPGIWALHGRLFGDGVNYQELKDFGSQVKTIFIGMFIYRGGVVSPEYPNGLNTTQTDSIEVYGMSSHCINKYNDYVKYADNIPDTGFFVKGSEYFSNTNIGVSWKCTKTGDFSNPTNLPTFETVYEGLVYITWTDLVALQSTGKVFVGDRYMIIDSTTGLPVEQILIKAISPDNNAWFERIDNMGISTVHKVV